jgi:hypothetical protein
MKEMKRKHSNDMKVYFGNRDVYFSGVHSDGIFFYNTIISQHLNSSVLLLKYWLMFRSFRST